MSRSARHRVVGRQSIVMPRSPRGRHDGFPVTQHRSLAKVIPGLGRAAIVLTLLFSYAYFAFRAADEGLTLASLGIVSFAAVAQFAPSGLGHLLWKGSTNSGALVGLAAGITMVTYTLLLPTVAEAGWLPVSLLHEGPLGLGLLRPQQLFGLTGMGEISHAMFWSMVVNVAGYVGVSLMAPPSAAAHAGTKSVAKTPKPVAPPALWRGRASVGELWALVEKFLAPGAEQAARAQARGMGLEAPSTTQAGPDLIHYVEELLVGAVGTVCARLMIASVVEREPLRVRVDTVAEVLDEASHVAVVEERNRLARELHDSVCQALFSMTLQSRALELAVQRTFQDPDGRIVGGLTELRELTHTALAEMRTLIFQLRPSALHERGLTMAVRQHAAAVAAREGVDIRVHAPEERLPLDELAEYELFRIIQEALHNSLKHADPHRVDIRLRQNAGPAGGLTVEVVDDGVGFDTRVIRPGHIGLECMRERAKRLGGRLIIDSSPAGTTIRAVLPGSLGPRPEVSPPTKPVVQGQ